MLRIRLQRRGRRNQPSYKVVVADSRSPIQGKFIDIVGFMNPVTKEKSVDVEKVKKWLSEGAQPTPTVHNFLVDMGIVEGKKVVAWRPKLKEAAEEKVAVEEAAITDDEAAGDSAAQEGQEIPTEQDAEEAPEQEALKELTEKQTDETSVEAREEAKEESSGSEKKEEIEKVSEKPGEEGVEKQESAGESAKEDLEEEAQVEESATGDSLEEGEKDSAGH